jgi:hypothetical protein
MKRNAMACTKRISLKGLDVVRNRQAVRDLSKSRLLGDVTTAKLASSFGPVP